MGLHILRLTDGANWCTEVSGMTVRQRQMVYMVHWSGRRAPEQNFASGQDQRGQDQLCGTLTFKSLYNEIFLHPVLTRETTYIMNNTFNVHMGMWVLF